MLPLAGSTIPTSADAFTEALRKGLTGRGAAPREIVACGEWPALESVRVDLTGVEVSGSQRLVPLADAPVSEFSVANFQLIARPAQVATAPIHVSLVAEGAVFALAPVSQDEMALKMIRAAHGTVTVEIARGDLEPLLHSLASNAAQEHGVEIKTTAVSLTSRGPRAVSLVAEVTAKMFIATADLKFSGDLDLDEHLVARLSNLQFHGEGMVANLAGTVIRPQLARLEGRTFPLMDFALGEISLRNVELAEGDPLRISADFAS